MPPKKRNRSCIVPGCLSCTGGTPDKKFFTLPAQQDRKLKWLRAMRRDPSTLSLSTVAHVCQDHFNLQDDLENPVMYEYYGHGRAVFKRDVVPHIFDCQPGRRTAHSFLPRTSSERRARQAFVEDILRASEKLDKETGRSEVKCDISDYSAFIVEQTTSGSYVIIPTNTTRAESVASGECLSAPHVFDPLADSNHDVKDEDTKPVIGDSPVLPVPEMIIKEEPEDDPEEEIKLSTEKACEVKEEDLLAEPEISVRTDINIYENLPKKEEGDDEILPANDMTLSECESCSICLKIIPSSDIIAHREKHAANKVHPCTSAGCKKMFSTFTERDAHELVHSGKPDVYACHICPRSVFSREDRLQAHMIFWHEDFEDILQCPQCPFRFRYFIKFNAHLKSHSRPTHKCYHCGFGTNKKAVIVHHRKNKSCRPFVCSACQQRYTQLHHLAVHWGRYHRMRLKSWIKYACPLGNCSSNHASLEKFYEHADKVHEFRLPEIVHTCISCEFQTSDPNILKQHHRKTGHSRVLHCPVCRLKYMNRLQFSHHLRACVDARRAENEASGSIFNFAAGSILVKEEVKDEDMDYDNDDGEIDASMQNVVGWMGQNDDGDDELGDAVSSSDISDLVQIKTEPQD